MKHFPGSPCVKVSHLFQIALVYIHSLTRPSIRLHRTLRPLCAKRSARFQHALIRGRFISGQQRASLPRHCWERCWSARPRRDHLQRSKCHDVDFPTFLLYVVFYLREIANKNRGYKDNEQETSKVISPDGWLRTGDLGYLDGNGYLYIYDRLKDLIKYKG